MMKEFDDNIPARSFDNFQFVNFTEIVSKKIDQRRKYMEFALDALMEIPSQYNATLDHGILGNFQFIIHWLPKFSFDPFPTK
ncbi:E3 ubiquitin-protein ligase RGLG1 [Dendrobium catenatum]|uniref:E3 ubiquitin-protein ligase RGLG1 n=1 Tax=Dendrobium catenatum TaxID=906689 RepID=A0A2I0X047_9ASPA|nr:E3 ubiquitin-protein ligase RGLG1 [Dendrobium catenatum]